jgi:hypothetical protein
MMALEARSSEPGGSHFQIDGELFIACGKKPYWCVPRGFLFCRSQDRCTTQQFE